MSNKATCPGCNSHTSSVWQAIQDEEPCPNCGLSAASIIEIDAVQRRRGDEKLKADLAAALLRAGRAEAAAAALAEVLQSVVYGSWFDQAKTAYEAWRKLQQFDGSDRD